MPAARTFNIVLLPGDGVGPEVTSAARAVLGVIGDFYGHHFEFQEHLIGGAAIDATGRIHMSDQSLKIRWCSGNRGR